MTDLTCVYHSGIDLPPSQKIAAGLCPPPDAFLGTFQTGFVTKTGLNSAEFRAASFYPLCDDPAAAGGVLVMVHGDADEEPNFHGSELDDRQAELHLLIAKMQHETASQLNLDLVLGTSARSHQIRRQIDVACLSGANLLITGPVGSGRRQIAELIHYWKGPQNVGPLIAIECALSDAETVQRTIKDLYRNFTDHPDEPLGRMLFLNVDQMSDAAQLEVLGFLKLPCFELPMMATIRPNSIEKINQGLYRELATLTISIPSLQDRRDDIALLCQAMVEEHNLLNQTQLSGIQDDTVEILERYPWPGEFAELKQVLLGACVRTSSSSLLPIDLPKHIRLAVRSLGHDLPEEPTKLQLDQFLAEVEIELIERAVSQAGGNKSQAAKLLGISRARLLRRLDFVASGESESSKSSQDRG